MDSSAAEVWRELSDACRSRGWRRAYLVAGAGELGSLEHQRRSCCLRLPRSKIKSVKFLDHSVQAVAKANSYSYGNSKISTSRTRPVADKPIHTSNNVETTFDISKLHSTLSPITKRQQRRTSLS